MLTEERNPRTRNIDHLNTLQMVTLINQEDRRVAQAVRGALPDIARAIDGIVGRLDQGGRLFYVGAGSSGRLGVLDAVECPLNFGVDPDLVQAILAGGQEATYRAVVSPEDEASQGQNDVQRCGVRAQDATVGISASGRTPYTLGACRFARRLGAFTVGVSCNEATELSRAVDVAVEILTGPEVVTGSTRMKAGTAQKMVLNMISTSAMIRLGNVYSNLMVNLNLANRKLIKRGIRVVAEAAGVPRRKAEKALQEVGDIRSAIVMLQLDCTADEARGLVCQSARVNEILRAHRRE